jgi:hypothetical protein
MILLFTLRFLGGADLCRLLDRKKKQPYFSVPGLWRL